MLSFEEEKKKGEGGGGAITENMRSVCVPKQREIYNK